MRILPVKSQGRNHDNESEPKGTEVAIRQDRLRLLAGIIARAYITRHLPELNEAQDTLTSASLSYTPDLSEDRDDEQEGDPRA